MSEKEYFKGQCLNTIYGLAYIEECHEDNTYTLRKVYGDNYYGDNYLGRLTAEEIEKDLSEEYEEDEEEDEDD